MDILYIGTLPPHHGGSAIGSGLILGGLARRGHSVRAAGPMTDRLASASDMFAARNPALSIRRFHVPSFETSPDLAPDPAYQRLERTQIDEFMRAAIAVRRPDVIVSGRESFAWYVPERARSHGVPCLQMVRGSTMMGILNGSYPQHLAEQLLERIAAADGVVTAARHLACELQRLGVTDVDVIPNPVDLDRFRPQPKDEALARSIGLEPDALVVAHFSNLKALKRVADLILAAELLEQHAPALSFLIVGSGPCRRDLELLASDRGLTGRIRFHDWIDYQQMPSLLSLADIVVMPSAGESQARVYLETKASAKTLIASDIPAAREVVEDGEDGLLFTMGDAEDLATKIRRAAGDPGLRAELGRRARATVSAHALESVVERYERLLERIAGDTIAQPALSHPHVN